MSAVVFDIQDHHFNIVAGANAGIGAANAGVRIGTRPLVDLVGDARASIAERTRSFIFACANPHSLVVAQADEEFRRALNGANVVVADGVGCLWGAG